MIIHLLKSIADGKTVTAKCGVVVKKSGGLATPLPPEFTGWASKVTCPECQPSQPSILSLITMGVLP